MSVSQVFAFLLNSLFIHSFLPGTFINYCKISSNWVGRKVNGKWVMTGHLSWLGYKTDETEDLDFFKVVFTWINYQYKQTASSAKLRDKILTWATEWKQPLVSPHFFFMRHLKFGGTGWLGSMRNPPAERRKVTVGVHPSIPLGCWGSLVCAHRCVCHPMRPFLQHNYITPSDLGLP